MQVPRNSKALAFGHEATLKGTLAMVDCYKRLYGFTKYWIGSSLY